MGMTMAEKILARASNRERVQPGEFVTAKIDRLMGHDLTYYVGSEIMARNGYQKVWDPDKLWRLLTTPFPLRISAMRSPL